MKKMMTMIPATIGRAALLVPVLWLAGTAPAPALAYPAVFAGEAAGPAASDVRQDPLPRRPFFGAQLGPVPDDAEQRGVLMNAVFEGRSADRAGLRQGDVVVSMDGRAVASVEEMLAALRGRRAGERFALEYLRDGRRHNTEVLLQEMPRESHPDIEVVYDALEVEGALRRTILTRPKGSTGRLPTVLLVGGIGCYSVDVPVGEPQAYVRILNELTRRGYATMRIEKTGMGDSQGPPCAEQDFRYELAGYVQAARAVRRYPFVDGSQVFLFGHSMGGVHAPQIAVAVAADAPLAGLMVKGTVGTSWFAYEMENSRRQAPLWGVAAEELEENLRTRGLCMGALTEGRLTPEAILAAHPECQQVLQFPAHHTYRRQLFELNLPGDWRQVRVPVLVLYGTSDFLTSAAEHHFIAGTVNRQRPGLATLRLLENMDHYFNHVTSYEQSLRTAQGQEPAEFDARIYDVLTEWMTRVRAAGR
jgi:uncharacterized protein